jgi:hypothetical protein
VVSFIVARGFIPARLRSSRKTSELDVTEKMQGSASHSSGDKSPRHKGNQQSLEPQYSDGAGYHFISPFATFALSSSELSSPSVG